MKSFVSAAWSAENRRQIRSVQFYRWLDDLQALAVGMLHEMDGDLSGRINKEGLSIAVIEAHMTEDCFPAQFLWHLLQVRATIERPHVTDTGSAFSRLFDLISGRLCLNDEVGRQLRRYFSAKSSPGEVAPLHPNNDPGEL